MSQADITMHEQRFDVLIVGAGLSGIGAAYHIKTGCPEKSYAILESRAAIGGTWDLFRYPGVRSGLRHVHARLFVPTLDRRQKRSPTVRRFSSTYAKRRARTASTSRSASICTCVARSGRLRTREWTVEARARRFGRASCASRCGFLFMCSGYYDYASGYTPEFPGMERFAGRIVHPQKWTGDIDYDGKRVVVIGSGATAVTLVPEMAKRAAHVTMLQRSPTYIVAAPEQDGSQTACANTFRRKAGVCADAVEERAARNAVFLVLQALPANGRKRCSSAA